MGGYPGGAGGIKGLLDQNTSKIMNRLNGDDMSRIRIEINGLFERKLNRMTIPELFLEIDRSG